jgi:2-phosphosulfolactate phosphatase
MFFDQSEYDIRCEWGEAGVRTLAPISDAIIIVDVMSFSTCVEIACSRGAVVFPYRWRDASARDYADSVNAELAASRGNPGQSPSPYSLSPNSLLAIPRGLRLVLPSPNGSVLALAAGATPQLQGCLRNCEAVARAAMDIGRRIAVIPAGERWPNDGTLRPAIEDWIGAGAIIANLKGSPSPEAKMAAACYRGAKDEIETAMFACASGKQLVEMGYPEDVAAIAQFNVSETVPFLSGGAFASR